MKKAQVVFPILILTFCLLLHDDPAWAASEVEPNTLPEQANLIRVGDAVTGLFEDSFDHFRVNLPSAGKVTVTLTGCPGGGNVQLGVKDFGHTGWEESNGRSSVSLTFDAKSTNGLVWVKPTYLGSACGKDWCVARFAPNGPYHVTKRSPHLPGTHEGVSVQPEVYYQLTVTHQAAGAAGPIPATGGPPPAKKPQPATPTVAEPAIPPGTNPAAGMKLFQENNFGFAFEMPAAMSARLLANNGGYMISGPPGSDLNELVIVVQAVSKSANPGSSAQKQLKEARHQIKSQLKAEINNEDERKVAGRKTEYFVATYPAFDSRKEKTEFKHMQLVLDNGSNYYWVSYSAPNKHFKDHKDLFFHMLKSFRFI
jgi:hypothetical protein